MTALSEPQTQTAEPIADEALFFLADQGASVDQVIHTLYEQPSKATVEHFKSVNEHLKGGQVKTGQMVIVTPPDPQSCQRAESLMMEAAATVDEELQTQSERERRALASRYAFINGYASVTGALFGQTNNFYSSKIKRVESTLKKIEQLYVESANNSGSIRNPRFFDQRRAYFIQLDSALNGLVAREMLGPNASSTKIKHKLGLSTRSIIHQWKQQPGAQSIKEFQKHYQNASTTSRRLARFGYAAMALDVGAAGANIHKACTVGNDREACKKATVVEPLKAAGSIAGGIGGGAAATYVFCSLGGFLFSGPTSPLWCAIVAGGAGGYAGGKALSHYGGKTGEAIYEAGLR